MLDINFCLIHIESVWFKTAIQFINRQRKSKIE